MIETEKIYTENCLETLKRMPDDLVDMTITSPPYDDLRDYNGYHFPVEEIAAGLFAKTKPGGVVIWVVADRTVKVRTRPLHAAAIPETRAAEVR